MGWARSPAVPAFGVFIASTVQHSPPSTMKSKYLCPDELAFRLSMYVACSRLTALMVSERFPGSERLLNTSPDT